MIKHIYLYTCVCLTFLTASVSWVEAQPHRGTFRLEHRVLREVGDSVELSLLLHLYARPLQECQSMWITPVLTAGDEAVCFPYIEITGRERSRANRRWQKTRRPGTGIEWPGISVALSASTDTLIRYRATVAWCGWMDDAELLLEEEFRECAGDRRLHTYSFDLRVEPASRDPYPVSPQVDFVPVEVADGLWQKHGEAFLDFRVNETVIDPSFGRNAAELDSIRRVMEVIRRYPGAEITSLSVTGYASPEGTYISNEKLARERAFAVEEYLRRHYDLSRHLFRVQYVAEDWDRLRRLVEESRMEHRYEMLQIIDRVGIFEGRELLLMKLDGGRPYRELLRDLFPRLRRVEYRIDFTLGHHPGALSGQSLPALPGGERDEELWRFLSELYPAEVAARVNLAALYLNRGDLRGAAALLDPVAEDPRAFNNLGVWYLLREDTDTAEQYFLRAAERGVQEATHNLEEIRRKREDEQRREKYTRRK
ncbi:MAG: DUF3868 domain-containing protein [Bacteroides sp.]|nr:DUF3868 domain-containing protein [Bacteroides sp.]